MFTLLFIVCGFLLVMGLPALVMFLRRKDYNPPDIDEISRVHFQQRCREIQRHRRETGLRIVAVLLLVLSLAGIAGAQAIGPASNPSTALSYTQGEMFTLSVDTPSLTLTTSQQTVNVTATWNLNPSRTQLMVIGLFTGSNALTSGANNITTAQILGQGLNSEQPCTGSGVTLPGAGTYSNVCDTIIQVTTTSAESGTQTKPFKIRLSPSALSSIPATTTPYTGTLWYYAAAN